MVYYVLNIKQKKYDLNCLLYLEKFSMYTTHQYKNQQKKKYADYG